jgi:hypothetical protein
MACWASAMVGSDGESGCVESDSGGVDRPGERTNESGCGDSDCGDSDMAMA